MYEPLHHKYRPQTFAQLVGQRAIADTLTHALQQARIAPAYLFCGPRGTGKTSSARILAKSLNCQSAAAPTPEPCGQCDVCQSVSRGNALDIVEIDAASNTGVDNIRELIERAQFAPVQCRYKVYAIDECHMLSTAAFNALLKTLEEPPDRVVFVLATTDPQRVLPTIISRCQRFDFRRIPLPAMTKHLSYIAAEENIKIAESAIQLVAQISQGGLRDAESLLDQLSLQADEITVESVWSLVGAVPERDLLNLVRAIAADDSTALLDRTRQLMDKGREPLIVLQSLVGFYRDLLIAKSAPTRIDLVAVTPPTWAEMTDFATSLSAAQLLAGQQQLQSAEGQVKNTTQPRLWLEITLTGLLPSALGAAANLTVGKVNSATVRAGRSSPPPAAPAQSPARPSESPAVSPPSEPAAQPVKPTTNSPLEPKKPAAEAAFGSLDDLWAKILAALKPRGTQMLMSQQGVLLGFDGVGAKVGFRSSSLQRMAQERIPNLTTAFEAVFQRPIKVSLEVLVAESTAEEETPDPLSAPAPPTPRAFALPNDPPS
ncbi:MAG: DNA polymerase III subunit gamma/tau, partial [Phormidesmis sp.]